MLHTCNNQERGNLGSSQAGASQQDPPPASSLLPNPHSCPSPLSVTPGKVYHILFGWSHQGYPAGKVIFIGWNPAPQDLICPLAVRRPRDPRKDTHGVLSLDIFFFNAPYTCIFIIEFQMSSLGMDKLGYDIN